MNVGIDLLKRIKILHSQGILYRDLKPSNIAFGIFSTENSKEKNELYNYFSNPEFHKNINLFLNHNNNFCKYYYNSAIKPTKVDLLVYNKTIENNPEINYRNFAHEQETKKRLCSRNVKRRTKTICFTRTLTSFINK